MSPSGRPPQRPIRRILVANRGEIAIRILQACRELTQTPTTFAIYTPSDSTHASLGQPDHAIQISSPNSYMDVEFLIDIVKKHEIDAVHPGYGFLSESADFSRRMWVEANCLVIGPGWDILDRTGDKLKAKILAGECQVPVLTAMSNSTGHVDDVRRFANEVGYPLMVKAVDGGGGRGIRLVQSPDTLQSAVERCISESPSKTVFAEQAAVKGFKHIEIQIIGDGNGGIKHAWERDCSVQRRFQKIVEVAPTPTSSRKLISQVIQSAIKMAQKIKYLGLGTFEFLVNAHEEKFFFLEINPRLQVEHTITESIGNFDLVIEQLLIAQGLSNSISFPESYDTAPPSQYSIQLRLCAEDPDTNFALSIGKVTDVQFPSGNGVRVDTHLSQGGIIGSDFDNLMAKIIVTASTWAGAISKSQRALAETGVNGVKTNLNLLRAIIADPVFQSGEADTQWLENNINPLVKSGNQIQDSITSKTTALPLLSKISNQISTATSSTATLRKGDAWSLTLTPTSGTNTKETSQPPPPPHHLLLSKLTLNQFPTHLAGELTYTLPSSPPQPYTFTLKATTSSSETTSSTHRRGDTNNKSHIVLPLSGKLVEVLVDEGDEIQAGQVVAFVKQMKMELEVRASRAGRAKWVIELEDEEGGDDVAEGVLIVELEEGEEVEEEGERGRVDVKSRL